MLKSHHQFFRTLFQLLDAFTIIASWFLSYWIRFDLQPELLPPVIETPSFESYVPVALVLAIIWFLMLQVLGAYKSWRSNSLGLELWVVLKASALAFVIFVSTQHFVAREEISRATLGIFVVFAVLGLLFSRVVLRATLSSLRRKGKNQRYVLFIGNAKLAESIEKRIRLRPELGFQIRGLIEIGPSETVSCISLLGGLESLAKVLAEGGVDHVLICLRNQEAQYLDKILQVTSEYNVDVKVVPDISHYAIIGFQVEEYEGLPVITLNQSPLQGWSSILKRISDIVYALLALTVFAIPMLVITLLIKLSSRGPVLYSQERMGLDGRTFRMLKFRSMRIDAEQQTGAIWAKENDPRVTWIGKILRRTSLDELPQLFNVLKGDMSCVGPRPERPVFVQQFKSQIPGYMLRHKVKAGMTGWAQVNGFRGNTSLEGRIEYDLYYISSWSLLLDLKIMFLTLFKGFISPHAY